MEILATISETFNSFLHGNYYGLITIMGLTVMGAKIMSLFWSLLLAIISVTWISTIAEIAQQEQAWAPIILAASIFIFISLYVVRWLQIE